MSKTHPKDARRAVFVAALAELKPAIRTIPPRDARDVESYEVPKLLRHHLDAAIERFAACFPSLAKEAGLRFVGEIILSVLGRLDGRPSAATAEAIRSALDGFPVNIWTVFRVVRGASLERSTSCCLGPFTFLQWPEEAARLKAAPHLPESDLHEALYLRPEDRCVFVSTTFGGYRQFRAAEAFADERFEQLETVLRYMLRDQAGYDLGIFEFREPHLRRIVSVSPTWSTMGVEPRGTATFVPMDLPLFQESASGHDRLWALLGKDAAALSEMERRVLTAVEWVGRGVYDRNPTTGFVQFMFAYEALLNYEGDGKTHFSPALGHGMAEIAAFVLSADRDERKATWARLKELYGLRCGIAHGGGKTASRVEYDEARQIVSRLVTRLLVDPDLKAFGKLQRLRDWATEKRFS